MAKPNDTLQIGLGMLRPNRERPPLPEGWIWTTIGDAYEVILGQSPPSSTYNTEGIGLPFYQGKAEFGGVYPVPVKWCSQPNKVAEAGDVLISVRAPVGPTNLCRERSCIGRGLSAVRPLGAMPSLYLLYYLRSIEQGWESKATGTTFSAINGKVLREQEISIAPLPEQHRIVEAIETQFTRLDAAVAALQRVKANLARYKASVLKAACEGRLVRRGEAFPETPGNAQVPSKAQPQGRQHPDTECLAPTAAYEPADVLLRRILAERRTRWEAENPGKRYTEPKGPDTSDLPELPEGWCWATVEQCIKIIDYRGRTPPYSEEGIPHLRSSNIRDGQVIWKDLRYVTEETYQEYMTRGLPEKDDLLFTTEAPLGEVAFAPEERFSLAQRIMILRPDKRFLSAGFLKYQIMSASFQQSIRFQETGSTVTGISSRNFRPVLLRVPPLTEQHRIVEEVERRLSVVAEAEAAIEANLARAERLRQAILKRAFAGRLVPQDPNDEPASALLERIRAR